MGWLDAFTGGDKGKDAALSAQREGTALSNRFIQDQTDQSLRSLAEGYTSQVALADPYRNQGMDATQQLSDNNFMDNFTGDPGYKFRFDEGQRAVENSASARGMLNSGATMKALARYGQGFASNEYGNAYNREYNRLNNLSGVGERANMRLMDTMNNYGTQRANVYGNFGQQVSNNLMGMANSQAAAEIGQADRQSNFSAQVIGAAAGGAAKGLTSGKGGK